MLSVTYGLASAASWGTGDFSGGMACRRNGVVSVVIVSQTIGLGLLIALALLLAEAVPSIETVGLGGFAGIVGTLGLMAFYRGLARGPMGVVAPVSAIVTAVLPIMAGMLLEGLPSTAQMMGFGSGVAAVWCLSNAADGARVHATTLGLALAAGVGFGLFLILLDRFSEAAILWPLAAARLTSVSALLVFATVAAKGRAIHIRQLPAVILAGVFDTAGNAFFALATRLGRLDISALLGSLYPAVTVLLAWLMLKEHLGRRQWIGVLLAIAALALIA